MGRKKYKQELINIKNYLKDNGVEVDEVTIWQGGFGHDGTKHGLTKIAKVMVDGKEEIYAVPQLALTYGEEQLKFLKIIDF